MTAGVVVVVSEVDDNTPQVLSGTSGSPFQEGGACTAAGAVATTVPATAGAKDAKGAAGAETAVAGVKGTAGTTGAAACAACATGNGDIPAAAGIATAGAAAGAAGARIEASPGPATAGGARTPPAPDVGTGTLAGCTGAWGMGPCENGAACWNGCGAKGPQLGLPSGPDAGPQFAKGIGGAPAAV